MSSPLLGTALGSDPEPPSQTRQQRAKGVFLREVRPCTGTPETMLGGRSDSVAVRRGWGKRLLCSILLLSAPGLTAIKSPRVDDCSSSTQLFKACVNGGGRTPSECLALYPEAGPCLERRLRDIISALEQGLAAPSDNACAETLRKDLSEAKEQGLEALLASGRIISFFSLVFILFGELAKDMVPPEFLAGAHLQSLGSADTCDAVHGYHYCWVAPTILPTSKAGVCLPDHCQLTDFPAILNPILQPFTNQTATLTLDNIVGQCGAYKFKATAGTYIMIVVTLLLALLVGLATAKDWWVKDQRQWKKEQAPDGYAHLEPEDDAAEKEEEDAEDLEDGGEAGATGGKLGGAVYADDRERKPQKADAPCLASQLLGGFSLYKTLPSLLAGARPGDFNTLDGIRTFSMMWVVLGHLYLWVTQYVGYSNEQDILPPTGLMATYSGQVLLGAEFAVDTFFTIGGFIACYMLTQHLIKKLRPPAGGETKALGVAWVPLLYVQRWLRLTPTYFFVLLFYWQVMRIMDSGPFWGLLNKDYGACEQYWWTNLLYINTLVPWDSQDVCYAVSWYMSVDFELFLLLPLYAVAFAYNRILGYAIPALLWAASIIFSWQLAYRKELSQFSLVPGRYQLDYYFKPWTRAPPYLVGVLFAFVWCDMVEYGLTWSQRQVQLPPRKRHRRLTWPVAAAFAFSFFLMGSVVYGATPFLSHPGESPVWLDHWYLAMSRSAWSVGLCTLLFLLFQGYGRIIIALLDNRLCAIMSRLTFCAYLIHPAVLSFTFADQQQSPHYSIFWILSHFLGTLVLVFMLSALVFLLVEKPLATVERLLLRGEGGKAQKKDK